MRIIFGFLLIGLAAHVQSYDAVDRLQLLEDRFKLQESLSPIGHDFALDTRLTIGGEIFDLVDDINEIQTLADSQAGGNENQIQAKFTELTQTWSGREFVGRYTLDAGIPLFKFKAWGLKFTPELLRFQLGATAVVGINEEVISKEDVISFLPDGVPQALQDVILSLDFNNASDNQDLALFISQEIRAGNVQGVRGELNLNEYAGLVTISPELKNALTVGQKLPAAEIYAKVESKIGPQVAWEGKHFFGHAALYGLGRMDYQFNIAASNVENMTDALNIPQTIEEWNMAVDASVGYRNANYQVVASLNEVKLFNVQESENADLTYENPMMVKIQADARFKPYSFLNLNAYGGVHKREGYDFMDGVYVGASSGLHVWKERLGINLRTQLDQDHLTLTPNLKFWIMQIDGMYKVPIASERDGVENSPAYSINLRFFI